MALVFNNPVPYAQPTCWEDVCLYTMMNQVSTAGVQVNQLNVDPDSLPLNLSRVLCVTFTHRFVSRQDKL